MKYNKKRKYTDEEIVAMYEGVQHLRRVWRAMWDRCTNPNNPSYPRYGGRGIRVCKRWRSFSKFVDDMWTRPSKKHSLDRRDNDLGYNRKNCRWATPRQQQNNRGNNRLILLDGKFKTLSQWARTLNMSPALVRTRMMLNGYWHDDDPDHDGEAPWTVHPLFAEEDHGSWEWIEE